ncbi:MAG TPA: choice-of-anchor Q domain-containing protein [Chthoniobacterales bacterium]|nr:choice-of-anchor Q domain-containing protein [Chthoniobacterales bacterium]
MNQFFAGGDSTKGATSTATQHIDVSANAADIDAGEVVCDFSAWLGGMTDRDDYAVMMVTFNTANMAQIASSAIAPVTRVDRSSQTKLLFRFGSIGVPANTRSIEVSLTMQGTTANAPNNAYADSLSVILRGRAVVTTTADSGAGSLRDAIRKGNVVTFDPKGFGEPKGPQTIELQSQLYLTGGIQSIVGPGADLLTVTRSSAEKFRILQVGQSARTSASALVTVGGLTLADGDVSGTPGEYGGAILVSYCSLVLRDCVLKNNTADSDGAISILNAAVTLDRCTIANNSASSVGAITNEAANGETSTITITNCTISGNATTDPTLAGPQVLYNLSDSVTATAIMNVVSTTISGNTGGFRQVTSGDATKATITLQNNIISSPGIGTNFTLPGGAYVSNGFNLSDQSDFLVLNQTGDRNNTDPMLGPLRDNGGRTPTIALLAGSPAIDKGNTSLPTDQRGFPRPVNDPTALNGGGNDSDIGAYEFGSSPNALRNLSTRARVESGDNVLIAGFIVTGAQAKRVIIRGLGPSLGAVGVQGYLDNPTLELRDSKGALLDWNDDWVDSKDKQAIIDSKTAPTNDRESAIVATLPANGATYTAILRGAIGATGIGVVEVYDLGPMMDSKLANISSRGIVSTGDDVMVAGTIIVGATPQKVVIRAIGPSLSVPGKLSDPTLELRDANGELIDANDDWEESPNKQAIIDSTLQPSDPHESAIVSTLSPNNSAYTAIVRGPGDSPGNGASHASGFSTSNTASPSVSRVQTGSGNMVEIQRVQFARAPVGGTFRIIVTRPNAIVSGQPGDKAALEDSITIPWNATADDIKAAIMASPNFYKYDQNNNLTAGPKEFHTLFDSGGGLGIAGNEGFRREPVVSGTTGNFTIQFGTLTTGNVGIRNTWITGLPLVQVDDSSIIYDATAVVEIYALH